VGVVVKYVQQVGGRYVYRRAVPERLREACGDDSFANAVILSNGGKSDFSNQTPLGLG
jgi:hypothetical protein